MPQKISDIHYHAGVRVTQSAADTATEATIDTQISTLSKAIWEVLSVEFLLNAGSMKAWAAVDAEITLTLQKETGALTFNSERLIARVEMAVAAHGTPANTLIFPIQPFLWVPHPATGLFVADSELIFRVGSTGTGVANVADMKIHYRPVEVSEIDLLRLRTQ